MTLKTAALSVLIAAAVVGTAAPALAQEWTFNPNAPLDVSAPEQAAFDQQNCTGELRGNVEINQDRVRLRARTMKTQATKRGGSCDGITRVEADGEVFYVTPNERVRADHAVYDLRADTVTFTGGVIVVRGDNVTSSDRLVVNLRTNDFTLGGGVRAVLYPERSSQ